MNRTMIHYSRSPKKLETLYDVSLFDKRDTIPQGLWLSNGEWYLYDGQYTFHSYVFEISNAANILHVDMMNIEQIEYLIAKYPYCADKNNAAISWEEVSKTYDGVYFHNVTIVERSPLPQHKRLNKMNFGGWVLSLCVDSCCLFRPSKCGTIRHLVQLREADETDDDELAN